MSQPHVNIQSMSKHFGGLKAIESVDLQIKRNEILGLIGPNGAGKSTLFNCIVGALLPNSGQVMFDSIDVTHLDASRRARLGMARTFQIGRLFGGLTVLENIVTGVGIGSYGSFWRSIRSFYVSRTHMKRAEELLAQFELNEYRDKAIDELPFGVQRRVETARALATGPSLLLLDEPAAGLTHSEALNYADMLRTVHASGVTLFVIEHDMPFAMGLAERMYVLVQGRIIASGTPTEIRENSNVIEAYLGSE